MTTLNDLFFGSLDRKYGRMNDDEIIHLEAAAANLDHIVNPGNKHQKIYAADVPGLISKAKEFNLWDSWKHKVTSEALPFNPYVNPKISGVLFKTDHLDRDVYEHLLQSTSFPILVPEDGKTFVNTEHKCFSLNNALYDLSEEMVNHLNLGKKFWLYSCNGRVAWYTRAEIEAQNKWKSAETETKEKIKSLFELAEEILRAKPIFDAVKQKNIFSVLPFTWYTGIKTVLSGLTEKSWGDGEQANTVNHLVVAEDYSNGRLKRKAHSFLCTAGGFGSAEDSKKEYSLKIAGYIVDTVPHKITCKTCLTRIERLLNNVDES